MKTKQWTRRILCAALAAVMTTGFLLSSFGTVSAAEPTTVTVDFTAEDREMNPLTSFLTPPNWDIPDGRYIPLNPATVRDNAQTQNWVDTRDLNLLATYPYEASEMDRLAMVAKRLGTIGVNFYALLGFTPSWLQTNGTVRCMPKDLGGWKQYVKDWVQVAKDQNLPIHDWDLWNENWGINKNKYLQLIRPTWEAIKGVDPDADIGGPSPDKYDLGFIKQALDYIEEQNLSWDNVTWHEFGTPPTDIPEHVRLVKEYIKQKKPIGVKEIWNEEYGFPNYDTLPAGFLSYLISSDDANLDSAAKAIWEYPFDNMSDMLIYDKTKENAYSRRPVWWVMQAYADMTGTKVKVSYKNAGTAIRALACIQPERREAMVLTGNDADALTQVSLNLKNIPYENAEIFIYELTETENEGFTLVKTVPVTGKNATLQLEYKPQGVYKLVARDASSLPGSFMLKSPDDGFNGTLNPVFTWEAARGAETYELVASKSRDLSEPVLVKTGITGTTYTSEKTLQEGDRYYWSVKAVNGSGSTNACFNMYYSFVAVKDTAAPGPFSALMPCDGTFGISLRPKFVWTKAYGASSYTLELSKTPDFTDAERYEVPATDKYENIYDKVLGAQINMQLTYDTKYYWRVFARNDKGQRIMNGPVFSFTTGVKDIVKNFTLTEPANGSTGVDKRFTLRWERANGAQFYDLEISENPDMSAPVVVRPHILTNAYRLDEQDKLESGKIYYWRVTAHGSSLDEPDPDAGTGTHASYAGLVDDSDPRVKYLGGVWNGYTGQNPIYDLYMHSNHVTETDGAYVEYTFNGSSIYWLAEKGDNRAKVKIYIDDQFQKEIDLYTPGLLCNQVLFERTDLAPGEHTIKIVNCHNGGRTCLSHDAFFTRKVNPNQTGTKTSAIHHFTVSDAPYSPIVKFLYTNPETNETFVSFMPTADAVSYNVYMSDNREAGTKLLENITDSYISLGKLGSKKWITVTSVNQDGKESSPMNFKLFDPAELPTKLPAPQNVKAVNNGFTYTVTWDQVKRADYYIVQWTDTAGNISSKVTSNTICEVPGLADGERYRIQVAAANEISGVFSSPVEVSGTDLYKTAEAEQLPLTGSLAVTDDKRAVTGWKTAGDRITLNTEGNRAISIRFQNNSKVGDDFSLNLMADGVLISEIWLRYGGSEVVTAIMNLPAGTKEISLETTEIQAQRNAQIAANLIIDSITLIGSPNLALDADVTVCVNDNMKEHLKDGFASGWPAYTSPLYEWHSYPGNSEGGEWVEYTFKKPVDIQKLRVFTRIGEPINDTTLTFDNGETVTIPAADINGNQFITLNKKGVKSIRMTSSAATPYICITEFEVYGADKTELETLYNSHKDDSKGNYTDSSWNQFVSALTEAEKVLTQDTASQKKLDAAKEKLTLAVDGLETGKYGVCMIQGSNQSFSLISDAVDAAVSGQTIVLLQDHTEPNIMLTKGVTLDLNGKKLTADYVIAFNGNHVIDSCKEKGLLVTPNMVLPENNAHVVLKIGAGYVFGKLTMQQLPITVDETGTRFTLNFRPIIDTTALAESYFADGATDNDLMIGLRATWVVDGNTVTQYFIYSDDMVAQVYRDNRQFRATLYGFPAGSQVTICPIVKSGSHQVVGCGAETVVTAGTI